MTPDHPKWSEFIERLCGSEGCDFRGEGLEAQWNCGGGRDQSKATAILKKMGNINIEESLDYFTKHGGYCDCEIVFNVDPR